MHTVTHEELKTIIKESVREALEEELFKLRLMFFPEVSDKEMREIISHYGKPEKRSAHSETISI
jgi:DNA primase large subunit